MRLLIDEHEYSWNEAWRITTSTLNYTITPCFRRRWKAGRWS
jgi:glucan phosphorylase